MASRIPRKLAKKIEFIGKIVLNFLYSIRKGTEFYIEITEYQEVGDIYHCHLNTNIGLDRNIHTWNCLAEFLSKYGIELMHAEKGRCMPIVGNPRPLDRSRDDYLEVCEEDYMYTGRDDMAIADKAQLERLGLKEFKDSLLTARREFVEAVINDAAAEIAESLGSINALNELSSPLALRALAAALAEHEAFKSPMTAGFVIRKRNGPEIQPT
jgi:hypothetical protein